jgi:hypothetical protein
MAQILGMTQTRIVNVRLGLSERTSVLRGPISSRAEAAICIVVRPSQRRFTGANAVRPR